MSQLDCPNPNCRKTFEVYQTEVFYCSGCGTQIFVAPSVAYYEESLLRQKARRESALLLQKCLKLSGIAVLLMIAGLLLRSEARLIGLALIICLAWAAYRGVTAKRPSRSLLAAALFAMILVGSILADLVSPPSARCADGTYSYSVDSQGTCSHHGGVAEENPTPWWVP